MAREDDMNNTRELDGHAIVFDIDRNGWSSALKYLHLFDRLPFRSRFRLWLSQDGKDKPLR